MVQLGQSYRTLRKNKDMSLVLRCPGNRCKKVLGIVDKNGILHTESNRSWIKTEIEVGDVVCKKCNNRLHWDKRSLVKQEQESKDGKRTRN